MQYKILSRSAAKKASYKLDRRTIIISITDPDKDSVIFHQSENLVAVCRVSFDDIDHVSHDYEVLMSDEDAKKIKIFIDRYQDRVEQIIVHCEAGQSRSAGVMAAIKLWLENDKFSVWDDPKYTPNRHCYRTMCNEIFGSLV